MRLLVVTNDYPPKPGGIQQWLGNVVDHFSGDVRVLAPADGPATNSRGESIVRRGDRKFMWPTGAVVDWVRDEIVDYQPDAILYGAPHPLPAMIPKLRSAFAGPIAVMTHGAEVTLPAAFPVARQWLRRTLRHADVLLAVSQFTAGKVGRLTGKAVTPVGAGVDVATFTPGNRPEAPVIGCVSRFVPRKGQDRLIEVAGQLRQTGIPVELIMVGKGRWESRLRRLAAAREVPTRFEVDVAWERLPELYREMSIFAMPAKSRWAGLEVEGLGIVYLEAAAAGLPVVAGNSGGAPEAVVPGVTGFVTHDDATLESAVRTLIENPVRATGMAVAGRQWVEKNHTWPKVAERIEAAIGEALGT
ncbi:MAG: glycosyltransferase family 4 protein [Acidimicrobiia bacterium]|nr:glycosyltransferase family 4 protein [Acidimicrobiia bacterium]